ncbi:hypothetical protein [Streptomyces mirabilis]|uniref:hypothetical protein n=1 Tax=Streptomyces mirabilis TaxID=68239 RepID=UPI0036D994B9
MALQPGEPPGPRSLTGEDLVLDQRDSGSERCAIAIVAREGSSSSSLGSMSGSGPARS